MQFAVSKAFPSSLLLTLCSVGACEKSPRMHGQNKGLLGKRHFIHGSPKRRETLERGGQSCRIRDFWQNGTKTFVDGGTDMMTEDRAEEEAHTPSLSHTHTEKRRKGSTDSVEYE